MCAAPKGNNYYLLGLDKTGKPPKYKNPEELKRKIIEYFEFCGENDEKLTITGLTLYVGFVHLDTLDLYSGKGEDFADIIKRARLTVMNGYEKLALGTTPTGAIFCLKNMGWKDTQQIDHTNAGSPFNNLSDDELISRINKLIGSREKG
jgi:hypothetical protein